MCSLQTIAIVIVCISFATFVALFGRLPVFRKTPIGFLHRLLWIHLPKIISLIDKRLTGGRISRSLYRTGDYLMNDAHPIILIFFLFLLILSEALFIPPAYPFLSSPHKFLVLLLSLPPYLLLYLATTTPSTVNPQNHSSSMLAYPYDHTLFHPSTPCRTCQHLKPSRSKHCSICRACIQKHDHHCIWINNCVGRNNYLYFVVLLSSISILLAYGACLGYSILNAILQERFVPASLTRGSLSSKSWSTALSWTEYADRWLLSIALQWRIGAVTMLSGMCFPLSTGLLLYHIYLIWAGTTTNESAKWADLKEDIADGLVWRARIDDLKDEYPPLGQDIEPDVKWPTRGKWWVMRTRYGVQPTRRAAMAARDPDDLGGVGRERRDEAGEVVDTRWEKVASLDQVENVYDLGFGGNLGDVVFNRE